MKVKLLDVLESEQALAEIVRMPLKAKTAYLFAKAGRKARNIIRDFQDARKVAIEKHGLSDLDFDKLTEKDIKKHKTAIDALSAELDELSEEEVDVDVQPIPFSAIENIEVKPAVLMLLDWLIEPPKD